VKKALALAYTALLLLAGCQGQRINIPGLPNEPPPYQLSVWPRAAWVPPNGEASFNLTFTARSGYWGVVRLEARTEMEEGASRYFSLWPDSFTLNGQRGYGNTVYLSVAPDTPFNFYQVYIWAVDRAGQVLTADAVIVEVSPEPSPWWTTEDVLLASQPSKITIPTGGEGSTTLILWIRNGHQGRVRAFVRDFARISDEGRVYPLPSEALRLTGNEVATDGSWTYRFPIRIGLPSYAQSGRYWLFWGVEVLEGPPLDSRAKARTEVTVP